MNNYITILTTLSCAIVSLSINYADANGFEFTPEVEAQFQYNDNVFLLADDEPTFEESVNNGRSDLIIDVIARGAGKYQNNSHIIEIDAGVFRRQYSEYNVLDFTGGNLKAKWDWTISPRLDTELQYNFKKDQSNFSEENLALGDLSKQNQFNGKMIFHLDSSKDIYLGASSKTKTYERRNILESERYDFNIGYVQKSSLGSSIGIEFNRGEGEYPNRTELANTIQRLQSYTEDLALAKVEWSPGDRSELNAQIGYINRKHNNELAAFDYNGVVYDFNFSWDKSTKTKISARYLKQLRDTENTLTLFNKDERLRFSVKWQYTNKLSFSSSLDFLDTDFIQSNGNRRDKGTSLEAGVLYDVSKNSVASFTLRTRSRSSNSSFNEFDNNVATFSYRHSF